MYSIKIAPDKRFKAKNDLIHFIKENKSDLIKLKKIKMKYTNKEHKNNFISEFTPNINVNSDHITVKSIINTTNYIDSHDDLHLPKIWNKTIKDKANTYHLDNHETTFKGVLSSKAISSLEKFKFYDIGFNSEMDTTALINTFSFKRDKNPLLFDMYANGEVKQHSVGMYYVNVDLVYAFDDDEDSQKELEDALKHAANPEVGRENGYVYLVSEAKRVEGSAVLFGSNPITPTISVQDYQEIENKYTVEPNKITQLEPQTKALNKQQLKELLTF